MSAFFSEFPISIMSTIGPDCLTYEEYAMRSEEFALMVAKEFADGSISNMATIGPDCLTYEEYSTQSQDFALAMTEDFAEIANICDELSVAPHWILNMDDEEEDHNDEIANICDELSVAPHWILNMDDEEDHAAAQENDEIANICDEFTINPGWVFNTEEKPRDEEYKKRERDSIMKLAESAKHLLEACRYIRQNRFPM